MMAKYSAVGVIFDGTSRINDVRNARKKPWKVASMMPENWRENVGVLQVWKPKRRSSSVASVVVGGRHFLWGPNFSEHLLLEAVPRHPFYLFSFQRPCPCWVFNCVFRSNISVAFRINYPPFVFDYAPFPFVFHTSFDFKASALTF